MALYYVETNVKRDSRWDTWEDMVVRAASAKEAVAIATTALGGEAEYYDLKVEKINLTGESEIILSGFYNG